MPPGGRERLVGDRSPSGPPSGRSRQGVPIHRTTPDRGTTPSVPGTTFEEDVVISAVVLAAEEGAEAASHLPIPPLAYGLLAFGGLVALLLVTYAFRSVGTRH